jgi:ATP-binding cassette subfamily F protein 3
MPYDGDLDSYRAEYLSRARDQRRGGATSINGSGVSRNKQDERRAAANARAELAPLRKRIDAYERDIKDITVKIARLDHALAEVGLYDNEPERALRLMRDRGALARSLGETEILWLEASERYEIAKAEQKNAGAA